MISLDPRLKQLANTCYNRVFQPSTADQKTFERQLRTTRNNINVSSGPQSAKWIDRGDRGQIVAHLQTVLKQQGLLTGNVDGIFGPITERAVKAYQRIKGIGIDGIIGPITIGKLTNGNKLFRIPGNSSAATNTTINSANPFVNAKWGNEISTAQNAAITQNAGKTWDPVSDKRIKTLHPKIQTLATTFVNRVESELGIKIRMTSGLRTFAEQNKLYAQGRTKPGNIVTNAKAGQSFHNFGLALDVVPVAGGKAIWNSPHWGAIAKIGKELGFAWGGDWKSFVDKPHFQMTFGLTTAQLRKGATV